jgi:phage shock protein C
MTPRTNRGPLELDRENRKFLGVCAGLANYLEVEAWTVRLVFLGCLIFGAWFLIPAYFGAWFLLDESSAKVREAVVESHMVTHFKNVDYKKKLYRNMQEGKVLGVCAGIADYLEVSVFSVRMIFLLLVLFTVFPLFFYFGAALVVDKKPQAVYYQESTYFDASRKAEPAGATMHFGESGESKAEARTQHARPEREPRVERERFSKRHEFQYAARKFANLQTRLARIEAYVTSKHFRLNREFRNMS